MGAVSQLVHAPEEGDGAEVLAAAELVRHPYGDAVVAGPIIAIIDPQ